MTAVIDSTGADAAAAWANKAWRALDPVHAVIYFSDEAVAAGRSAGLKGFWMTYFAFRAAPLGAASAGTVQATFYNFHHSRVDRAIPDAWGFCPPEQVLEARLGAARAAITRVTTAAGVAPATIEEAATLGRRLAELCECSGRPLAAANQALAWPDDPIGILWLATTVLREHRGDGHLALLVEAELDGGEALVLHGASGMVPSDVLRQSRNWPDDEWEAAVSRLAARGLVDADGATTPAGAELRARIESDTDRLATGPYRAVGVEVASAFRAACREVARAVVGSGGFPRVNPIGLDPSDE